jgi:hypothetical protein
VASSNRVTHRWSEYKLMKRDRTDGLDQTKNLSSTEDIPLGELFSDELSEARVR